MTNMVDERVLQARRQIGSEMMQLMYYFIVISFCIKSLYFGMGLQECMTEFIILISAPIYQAYRSRKLGVVLGNYRKASKASNIISIAVGLSVLLLSLSRSTDGITTVETLTAILTFVVVFSFTRFGFAHIEAKRAKKLEEEYDED